METRIAYRDVSPDLFQAMLGVEARVIRSGLDRGLLELVKIRASQINGCAHCLDIHFKDARARGETNDRLDTLVAWRESPFFSPRERAALAWAEAVTLVAEGHVPDPAYEAARAEFGEKELVDLTWAVATINAWNRVAIAMRAPVGEYQVQKVEPAANP